MRTCLRDSQTQATLWQALYMPEEHHSTFMDSDRRLLVRAATRLLGPADAEDAVQDAFVRALELGDQTPDVAPAWLLTVMRNRAVDILRRRQWLQQWVMQQRVMQQDADGAASASPSAEVAAALAQEVNAALRHMAACLSHTEAATVLLHEVFEASHAEIAEASGKSEAGSRQQLRRALARLRQAGTQAHRPQRNPQAGEETMLRISLHALQSRDAQALWAMLNQPTVVALMVPTTAAVAAMSQPQATTCSLVQVAGQLGLVLTLDGVALCVLPLGVRAERDLEATLS
jgi:RNA polymerase sigma factor (sigma-70 family)